MNKITPFLWFDSNAEDAATFYLSIFPNARKVDEVRSNGVGPWPAGALATITIELEGQQVTFLNGGPAFKLNAAFSFTVTCETQQEIDRYWSALGAGGKEMQCGWLTDKFSVCWQIVPAHIADLIRTPKGMQAMMSMVKFDIAALEKAAKS
jgi:predicted 3-demethylubiquinone-9 3-methyltransferase (glyoxalase superfamily)